MGTYDDTRLEGRLLLLTADFLTVTLLTAGTALAFLSGYSIRVELGAVLFFCIAASAVSAGLHSLTRVRWSVGAAALIAGIFWLAWEDVFPVLQWIWQKTGLVPGMYAIWSYDVEERLLPVFLLLCAALAWSMGWMAVRIRRWYLTAMLSFLLVLPAIQMGVLPSWGAMLAAFAGWGTMLLTSLYGREDPVGLGLAQLLGLCGMGGLILVLVMCLPMEGYLRPQWATDARNDLILGVRRQLERHFDLDRLEGGILADLGLDLTVPGEGGGPASPEGGGAAVSPGGIGQREDLLAAGPRRYSGRRVLTVRTDQTDGRRVYLRGGSLGTYTGTSWERAEADGGPFFSDGAQPPEAQPTLYPARTAAEEAQYTMTIRNVYHGGGYFYPYRLTDSGGWTDEAGNLSLPDGGDWMEGLLPAGNETYQVNYIPGGPQDGFVPLPEELAMEEGGYQAEVAYGHRYLEVPDAARQALEPLMDHEQLDLIIASFQQELDEAGEAGREELEESLQHLRDLRDSAVVLGDFDPALELPEGTEQFRWPLEAAARTAALLAAYAVYDPYAPAMEPGEDFVTHFLAEGRGYCIHFATAGTLLLRMQGVPARYVTGYTVQLNGQGRGEALDSDAHAWVEIYLDGYGWYPVDMTPGYAGGATGTELADEPEAGEADLPQEPEPVQTPEEEEPPEPEAPEQEAPSDEALPPEEEPENNGLAAVGRALAGAALAGCAAGALYALALLLRRRQRAMPDANRSVIWAYRRYALALRWGGRADEALEELGRKAKFSQHILTEEERTAAWTHLDAAAGSVRERRKGAARWLFSLLRPVL